MDKNVAIKVVELAKSHRSTNSKKDPFVSFIIGCISLVISFAVLNGLIYGAQEIYHWSDMKECERMENELGIMKDRITEIERDYQQKERELEEINQLSAQLEGGTLTNSDRYDELIEKIASALLSDDNMIKEYDELIENYNETVDKYNALASSAYRRWWLLPIPLPNKHIL